MDRNDVGMHRQRRADSAESFILQMGRVGTSDAFSLAELFLVFEKRLADGKVIYLGAAQSFIKEPLRVGA